MNKLVRLFNVLFKSDHLRIILRDYFKQTSLINDDNQHLQGTMGWLKQAHDVCFQKGVSAGYDLRSGWMKPYPETTGYIIPTFLKYAKLSGLVEFRDRAIQMGKWEINIQLSSGAVRGGVGINDYPIVFNTGQVIIGWLTLYKETHNQDFLKAAIKAADWLIQTQNEDGSWDQSTYNDISHTYHSRVAWPLLELYDVTRMEKYKISGEKSIAWILSQAQGNSWINKMGFISEKNPFTHTIGYTLRGLWESSFYLNSDLQKEVQVLVIDMATKMMHVYERKKPNPYAMPLYLPATFNQVWRSQDNYSCLTGDAQIAIVWLKLYQHSNDARFLNAALKIIDQIKSTQSLDCKNSGIAGGVAGSYPVYGRYMKLMYPNWAAKFLADAIMLQEDIINNLEKF